MSGTTTTVNVVHIYGRKEPACPFCQAAEKLCHDMGYNWEYHDYSKGEWTKASLAEKRGCTENEISTVPQIFINEEFIGGYDQFFDYVSSNRI